MGSNRFPAQGGGATGPRGATGPGGGDQGVTGPRGATGIRGVTGAIGPTGLGATGIQGVTGPQGVTGIQGFTGAGIQGATGVAGVPGATGIVGFTGAGIQGITGAIGSQGVTGSQGRTGVDGATGVGAEGATGPQGNQGVTGSLGATGVAGMTGVGQAGATWFNGSGVPSVLIGSNGDFYIDTVTTDYYKKIGGFWVYQGSFRGATGIGGATGIRGVTGAIGATGVAGQTGVAGVAGATGIRGTGAIFLTGSGVPSSGIGTNGDIYINDDTSDWYLKESGFWVLQGNFGGATGVKGTTGVGAQGATGVEIGDPAAARYYNTNQTGIGPGETGVALNFDLKYSTEDYDTESAYNPATGIFTTPVTGKYQFNAEITLRGEGGASGEYALVLLVNDVEISKYNTLIAVGTTTVAIADILDLEFEDQVKVAVQLTADGSYIVIQDDTSVYFSCSLLSAAAGPRGATGPSGGAQGVTGVPGATGIRGNQGHTGVDGATGVAGVQGMTGVAGQTGVQGIQGTTGSQGFTGVAGQTGVGAEGATGVQGIQGVTGQQGFTGVAGQTGVAGVAGAAGSQGVTGSQGFTGVAGQTGVAGVQGVTGSQGFTGVAGQTGVKGVTGAAPASPVAFRYKSAPTGIALVAAPAIVKFPTLDYDTNSAYSAATGLFTVPTTGKYYISAEVGAIAPGAVDTYLYIYVNGSAVSKSQLGNIAAGSGNATTWTVEDTLSLTAADTVGIYVSDPSSTAEYWLSPGDTTNRFSMFLVGGVAGATGVGPPGFSAPVYNGLIASPANAQYTIELYAPVAFTITTLKIITDSGTITANVKINSTSVTSVSAVAVSSTIASATATAANSVAVGDKISITFTSNSSAVNLAYTLYGTNP